MISAIFQRLKFLTGFAPVDNDGTAIVGDTIDRRGYLDGYVSIVNAGSSGTPTTAAAAITVYHGDASNMSDEALFCTCAAAVDVKTANCLQYPVDLTAAKRYIRVKLDTTYSGGTSPKNLVAAAVVLGNKNVDPAVASETVLGR
jgi:hypothetical protein